MKPRSLEEPSTLVTSTIASSITAKYDGGADLDRDVGQRRGEEDDAAGCRSCRR